MVALTALRATAINPATVPHCQSSGLLGSPLGKKTQPSRTDHTSVLDPVCGAHSHTWYPPIGSSLWTVPAPLIWPIGPES